MHRLRDAARSCAAASRSPILLLQRYLTAGSVK
jgi:hypothetical protein